MKAAAPRGLHAVSAAVSATPLPTDFLNLLSQLTNAAVSAFKRLDARVFQITFLLSLLVFGALARDFSLTHGQVAATFLAALLTQAFWQFALQLPTRKKPAGYLSAVVTACSLSILLRSDVMWVHPLLACLAMSSKFVLRFGKGAQRGHIFNPANLACAAALWWVPHAWLSPGQWGFETIAALWMVMLGALITGRVARWGISLAFLGVWLGLLAARLWWLGVAPDLASAQWLHQAQNGATLLFAFFMISDPMTTPQHAKARLAYGACVAITAFVWQFYFFKPMEPIVALVVWSMTVPLWNALYKAQRFDWKARVKSGCLTPSQP